MYSAVKKTNLLLPSTCTMTFWPACLTCVLRVFKCWVSYVKKKVSLLFGLYIVFHFLYVCACIFVRGKSVCVCVCGHACACACLSVNGVTGVAKQQRVHISGSFRSERGLHGNRGSAAGRHRAGGGQRGGQPGHAVPQGQGAQTHRRPPPRQEGREGEVRAPSVLRPGVGLWLLSGWDWRGRQDCFGLSAKGLRVWSQQTCSCISPLFYQDSHIETEDSLTNEPWLRKAAPK